MDGCGSVDSIELNDHGHGSCDFWAKDGGGCSENDYRCGSETVEYDAFLNDDSQTFERDPKDISSMMLLWF